MHYLRNRTVLYPELKSSCVRRKVSKSQPENILQKKMKAYLQYRGLIVVEHKNGATWDRRGFYRANTTDKGVPDMWIGLPRGLYAWVEIKTKTGRVSKEQRAFIKRIHDHGGLAFVARSTDDLDKHLSEFYNAGNVGAIIDEI